MIQIGDLVKHAIFQSPSGVGVVVDIQHNRYRVRWIESPYNSKHSDTWCSRSQVKLMEKK